MIGKAYPGAGTTQHEYLGAGAVYLNWGLANETRIGITKGGSEFSDNAEFREREADGDYLPVKGHRDIVKMMPQLTVNALRLSVNNIITFMAGASEDNSTSGETRIYRTLDLSASYIDNVAYVGSNREGKLMVIVLENVLADSPIALSTTAKSEELVISPVFTAHADDNFNPDTPSTYPYYFLKDTSQVTFTVDDGVDPVEGAKIVVDLAYGLTDVTGVKIFTLDKAEKVYYTVNATGFDEATGSFAITADTTPVAVTLTATP